MTKRTIDRNRPISAETAAMIDLLRPLGDQRVIVTDYTVGLVALRHVGQLLVGQHVASVRTGPQRSYRFDPRRKLTIHTDRMPIEIEVRWRE